MIKTTYSSRDIALDGKTYLTLGNAFARNMVISSVDNDSKYSEKTVIVWSYVKDLL